MRRTILAMVAALVLTVASAWAQSWTAPRTWTTGELVTKTIMDAHVRDNLIVLRAGGVAVTSQAIGDLLCASSTTQFARLADVATGQVVVSGGVGVCPAYSATLPTAVQDNITRLGTVVAGSFPAANLSGTALPAAIVTSSLTSTGTVTSGTWGGGFSDAALTAIDAGTWTGAASLTTLGTVTSGVWNAGAVTSSGLLTVNAFGAHAINGNSNGALQFQVNNTTVGTASEVLFAFTAGAVNGSLETFSNGFTTSGVAIQASTRLYNDGVGGLILHAIHASGAIGFYTGGSTKKFAMQADYGLEVTAGTPSVTTNVLYNVAGNLYFNGSQLQTGTTLPAGLIAMFDAACSAGWTRVTALDNAFPRGAATYGGTGGAATHTHTLSSHTHTLSSHTHTLSSHTHSGTTSGPSALEAITTGGISVATDTHTHTVTTGAPSNNTSGAPSTDTSGAPSDNNTNAGSSLPPYLDVVWCKKN